MVDMQPDLLLLFRRKKLLLPRFKRNMKQDATQLKRQEISWPHCTQRNISAKNKELLKQKAVRKIDAIKADCEGKLQQLADTKDKQWQELADQLADRQGNKQNVVFVSGKRTIDSQAFPDVGQVLSDGSAPASGNQHLLAYDSDTLICRWKSIEGGRIPACNSLNGFGPPEVADSLLLFHAPSKPPCSLNRRQEEKEAGIKSSPSSDASNCLRPTTRPKPIHNY